MKNKTEDLVVWGGGIGLLLGIAGLIFLMWHVFVLPIALSILLPLIAILFAIKTDWITAKVLPVYSYSVIGLSLLSSFVLMIGRIKYVDTVGPLFLKGYEHTWYETENEETGQPMEARGYRYDDTNGDTKSSIIEAFFWVVTIGSPILIYVQTKKRYNVLTHTATN